MTEDSGPTRAERAVDAALAVTFLVAALGAVLIAVSLLFQTRATIPALGLILFLVGLVTCWQLGVRPALRQRRAPVLALIAGLRRLTGWTTRMVRGR